MINRKLALRILWLILFAVALSSLIRFLEPRRPGLQDTPVKTKRDFRITGLDTTKFNANGKILFRLRADTMTHFPSRSASTLDKPVLLQYGDRGGTIETRADSANLSDDQKVIEMLGNVVTSHTNRAGELIGRAETRRLTLKLQ
jgi:LPS export ABC transporter protein LptC